MPIICICQNKNCKAAVPVESSYIREYQLGGGRIRTYCNEACADDSERGMHMPIIQQWIDSSQVKFYDMKEMFTLLNRLCSSHIKGVPCATMPMADFLRLTSQEPESMSDFATLGDKFTFWKLHMKVVKLASCMVQNLIDRNTQKYRLLKQKLMDDFVDLLALCPNDEQTQEIADYMAAIGKIFLFEGLYVR